MNITLAKSVLIAGAWAFVLPTEPSKAQQPCRRCHRL